MDHTSIPQMIISIVLMILIGAINAYFAEKRGRNPMIWFFLGTLLGIFGLLILFILPSYAKEKEGVEVKEDPKEEKITFIEAPPLPPAPAQEELLWYYLDQKHQQCGPVPYSEIKDLLNRNDLTQDTYVWSEGMENWKRVRELPSNLTRLP